MVKRNERKWVGRECGKGESTTLEESKVQTRARPRARARARASGWRARSIDHRNYCVELRRSRATPPCGIWSTVENILALYGTLVQFRHATLVPDSHCVLLPFPPYPDVFSCATPFVYWVVGCALYDCRLLQRRLSPETRINDLCFRFIIMGMSASLLENSYTKGGKRCLN